MPTLDNQQILILLMVLGNFLFFLFLFIQSLNFFKNYYYFKSGDSYYEYLVKQWIQSGKTDYL